MRLFRPCIPIKPGRFGIKAFNLAESRSGYILNSKIYTDMENIKFQGDLERKVDPSKMSQCLRGQLLNVHSIFEGFEERQTLECSVLPKEICG